MPYILDALIAQEPTLHRLLSTIPTARIVPLADGLALTPMTSALSAALAVPGAPKPAAFWNAPPGLSQFLTPAATPVAYVEADYFGGTGTQAAQIWHNGTTVLGPLTVPEGHRFLPEGSPISQALRFLGTPKSTHYDEFEAAGLHRHRSTAAWAT